MKNTFEYLVTIFAPAILAPKLFMWLFVPLLFSAEDLTLSFGSAAFVLGMATFTGLSVYATSLTVKKFKEMSAAK
jgi:hypothetical protein